MKTKEEFLAQQEMEAKIMDAFIKEAPLDARMGGRRGMLKHIAQTAVDLYENEMQNKRDSEVDQVFEKTMRGE